MEGGSYECYERWSGSCEIVKTLIEKKNYNNFFNNGNNDIVADIA